MQADLHEFKDKGYLILRQVIPPDMLEDLRQSFDELVRREWPEGPSPGRPPQQPRIYGFEKHIDASTANILEFCLHDNVLDPCRQLLQVPDVGMAYMFLMCNPVRDYGPWFWHRDFTPLSDGPLQGMQLDFAANGPAHLQWNIALYDDDVLWIVPGSHPRPNTEDENRQLAAVPHTYAHNQQPQGEKRHEPLPGSVPVDLKAGDGVVYANMLLHWGSNYSTQLRRCIHMGYRGFDARSFYHNGFVCDANITRHLSPERRAVYERLIDLYERECNTVEAVFHAIIHRDEAGFRQGLAQLHPAATGRLTCLILLSKIAQRMQRDQEAEYRPRFSPEETQTLWQRFTPLDQALRADGEDYLPGFLIKDPVPYRIYDSPEDFDIDTFVATWNGRPG